MPSGYKSIFHLSTDKDKEVISLYKSKMSIRAIGIKFGVDRLIISKVLKRNNIKINRSNVAYDGLKKCNQCSEEKEISKFYRRKNGYLNSVCKACKISIKPNKETVKIYRLNNNEKFRASDRKRYSIKKLDSNFIIKERIRISIISLISARIKKSKSTFDLLGYDVIKLKERLSVNFKEGMSFDNFGEWHIDHKKPISSFELKSDKDLAKIWSLSNLQPLWAKENLSKGSLFKGKRYYYK